MTKQDRNKLIAQLDELERNGWEVEVDPTLSLGDYRVTCIHPKRWIAYTYESDETIGHYTTLAEAIAGIDAHRRQGAVIGHVNVDADGREVIAQ